jgi:hypothetical protein
MFDEKDLQQIREHGLTPEQAETQLENFRRGFPFLNVVRAASPGDGVLVVGAAEADAAVERYEKESAGLTDRRKSSVLPADSVFHLLVDYKCNYCNILI